MVDIEKVIRYGTPEGIKHLQVDISPVFNDSEAFAEASEYIYQMFERELFDTIVAVDSAGTVFASVIAAKMKKPLAIVSHSKSMLGDSDCETIETHHGKSNLYLSTGSIKAGQKAIIIGDMLSYGKDVLAATKLMEKQGGKLVKIGIFVENSDFCARKKLLKGMALESCIITADF